MKYNRLMTADQLAEKLRSHPNKSWLARETGVSLPTIKILQKGGANPREATLRALTEYFDKPWGPWKL